MDFSELPLPLFFQEHYHKFPSLTPIQEKALQAGLLQGTSLLACAPTASGKTMIATMALCQQVGKGKVIYLVPLKALASEKYKEYQMPEGQKYNIKEYSVEGDYSGAGYFAAIAVLTQSKITLKNLNPQSIQGDKEFLEFLKQMGNKIIFGDNEVTVIGKCVKPIKINMKNCPDQAQTLAVLAAFAKGITLIKGVRSLRVKETERVKALEQELAKMGIKTKSSVDTLTIYGGNPKAARIDTYGDHRMAMSFAVAGTKLKGMEINNPEVVSKTFPDFWEKIEQIGVQLIK